MRLLAVCSLAKAAIDWQQVITSALPVAGLALMLFCVASFFFSFGQRFKESKQTIRGFGVDLQISVLSLFLLIGFLLSCSGIFLYVTNRSSDLAAFNHKIADLQGKLDAANERADRAARFSIRLNLMMPQKVEHATIGNLECWYIMASRPEQWTQVSVSRGLTAQSVRVTLLDVGRDDVLEQLELREQGTQKIIGSVQNVYPLQRLVQLN